MIIYDRLFIDFDSPDRSSARSKRKLRSSEATAYAISTINK